ncbi:protein STRICTOSIDINE SYNTHASE-LIKE 2 [Ziziphus jujuba]|uniref:Protein STRICTOSIDINE SYNTHASE-LIKE 2 n=1 Tax=Ziziphus jujuba TaxID=326968 RepID=A0A6P4BD48_ZIZJJ|nr:protein STRICTOSIDINE SYNTHASE-LIKE 2 [Ziziphus jujuba]
MPSSKLFFTATVAVLLSALSALNFIKFSFFHAGDGELQNHHSSIETVPITGAVGPETYAFDRLGEGPYTGVSDGRIIKWQEDQRQWITFAVTSSNRSGCEGQHDHDQTEHICGRPLGLRFNKKDGDLYIADAYMGLLVVGPQGGLATRVANEAQGIPFGFTNSVDIDEWSTTGAVYFTDSTSRYQRRNYVSVILSGDKTGRLMKYDPQRKRVEVLLRNLSFPNGVALSQNGDFLLVAETSECRIMRYWLRTSKAGSFEVFAQLPGFPDNIKMSPRGGFWVGIHSRREWLVRRILSYPVMGKTLVRLPINIMKAYGYLGKWRGSGLAMRLSEEGEILDVLEDKTRIRWKTVSEVKEKDGTLWIGSINKPFAVKYKV